MLLSSIDVESFLFCCTFYTVLSKQMTEWFLLEACFTESKMVKQPTEIDQFSKFYGGYPNAGHMIKMLTIYCNICPCSFIGCYCVTLGTTQDLCLYCSTNSITFNYSFAVNLY